MQVGSLPPMVADRPEAFLAKDERLRRQSDVVPVDRVAVRRDVVRVEVEILAVVRHEVEKRLDLLDLLNRPERAAENTPRGYGRRAGSLFFSIFTSTVYSGSTSWMIGAFAFCETNW